MATFPCKFVFNSTTNCPSPASNLYDGTNTLRTRLTSNAEAKYVFPLVVVAITLWAHNYLTSFSEYV